MVKSTPSGSTTKNWHLHQFVHMGPDRDGENDQALLPNSLIAKKTDSLIKKPKILKKRLYKLQNIFSALEGRKSNHAPLIQGRAWLLFWISLISY